MTAIDKGVYEKGGEVKLLCRAGSGEGTGINPWLSYYLSTVRTQEVVTP